MKCGFFFFVSYHRRKKEKRLLFSYPHLPQNSLAHHAICDLSAVLKRYRPDEGKDGTGHNGVDTRAFHVFGLSRSMVSAGGGTHSGRIGGVRTRTETGTRVREE